MRIQKVSAFLRFLGVVAAVAMAPAFTFAAEVAPVDDCTSVLSKKSAPSLAMYMTFAQKGLQAKFITATDVQYAIESAERGIVQNIFPDGTYSSERDGLKKGVQRLVRDGRIDASELAHALKKLLVSANETAATQQVAVDQTKKIPGLQAVAPDEDKVWKEFEHLEYVQTPDGRTLAYPTRTVGDQIPFAFDIAQPQTPIAINPELTDYNLAYNKAGDEIRMGTLPNPMSENLDVVIINVTKKDRLFYHYGDKHTYFDTSFQQDSSGETFAVIQFSAKRGGSVSAIKILSIENPDVVYTLPISNENRRSLELYKIVRLSSGENAFVFDRRLDSGASQVLLWKFQSSNDLEPISSHPLSNGLHVFDTPKGPHLLTITTQSFLVSDIALVPVEKAKVEQISRVRSVWSRVKLQLIDDIQSIFSKKDRFATGPYDFHWDSPHLHFKSIFKDEDGLSYAVFVDNTSRPPGSPNWVLVDLADVRRQEKIFLPTSTPTEEFWQARNSDVFRHTDGDRRLVQQTRSGSRVTLKMWNLDKPDAPWSEVEFEGEYAPLTHLRSGAIERLVWGPQNGRYEAFELMMSPQQAEVAP